MGAIGWVFDLVMVGLVKRAFSFFCAVHFQINFLGFNQYSKGQGVPQNHILAYAWFNLSAAQGNKNAVKNRDFVAEKLSSEQLIEAQALSLTLVKE